MRRATPPIVRIVVDRRRRDVYDRNGAPSFESPLGVPWLRSETRVLPSGNARRPPPNEGEREPLAKILLLGDYGQPHKLRF